MKKPRSVKITTLYFRIPKLLLISQWAITLLLLFSLQSSASPHNLVKLQQVRTISGTVTDSDGLVLAGVTVKVKGTALGTTTDADGRFTMDIPENAQTLVLSYVGMLTRELEIGDRTVFNVTMELDVLGLEEVVVTGYGVQKKSDVTGAISKVREEDLYNRSTAFVGQSIQGKSAGVQIITPSGAPGKGSSIRVRGISSNNPSEPLFVVDGLIVSSLDNLEPNNIESIEVLKDAASAAIYGISSGNGVILVTTRKGKAGTGKITYDFQYSAIQLPPKHPEVMNAQEYINFMLEGNYLTEGAINDYWDGMTDTDWFEAVFETGITERHNLGFEGGNDRGNYFMSLSYTKTDGIIAGAKDTYKRISAMLNADYKVKSWLSVGTTNVFQKWSAQAVEEGTEYGGMLAATLMQDPLTPVTYTDWDLPDYMRSVLDGGQYELLQDEEGAYYAWSDININDQTNPFIIRDRIESYPAGFNLNGTLFADLEPIPGLVITSRFGYKAGYISDYTWQKPYYGNTFAHQEKLLISRTNTTFFNYQWDNYASYSREFGSHSLQIMAGSSYIEPYINSTGGSVDEITKDDPLYRDIYYQTISAIKTVSGSESIYGRLFSLFGRLNYNYSGKYLFQASVRRDAGDRSFFPADNNVGIFPAVSAGWVISGEDFFPRTIFINHLKLRASWGQNGTYAHLTPFLWSGSITSAGFISYTEYEDPDFIYYTASSPNQLENLELTWETTEQTNIGIDLMALRNRLSLNADWYIKKTKDLLVTIIPPIETGQNSATINAGDVRNTGLEFELGWSDRQSDFSYSARTNLSTLKNEVTYLDPRIDRILGANMHTALGLTAFEEGFPAWYFRGYHFEGVDPATGEPVFTDKPIEDTDGDGKLDEGDGIYNNEDKVMLGKGYPDITYGFTLNAAYKGFDLLVFGYGQSGNDIYYCYTRAVSTTANRLKYFYDDRWTADNTDATVPRPGAGEIDKYFTSNGVVFDGSFFKIKQIQLGYTLPDRITNKFLVNNLRLYLSLDDWLTFTKYPGYDPEVSTNAGYALGVDKGSYPISRKLVFGINVTF